MNIFDILIVQPIFNLLIGIYSIIPGHDFGLAVIIFTIIVRFALYPLLKRQLHQTRAMQKLQPKLAQIKKEAKGNRQVESLRMMELYKEHGVSPFRSIVMLLIQLPIFISLYTVIRIFTLHRDQIASYTYSFMKQIGPIKELIAHPTQFHENLFGVVNLTHSVFSKGGIDITLLGLALLAAAMQFFMARQTMPRPATKKGLRQVMAEAAEGKTTDQAEMNAIVMGKMSMVFPFFIFFIMISLPGALVLYYAVSNLLAVIMQAVLLKEDEEELEALADKTPIRPATAPSKKATAKARAKVAKEATVTRITANETKRGKS